jgi:hypothetical protein
MSNWFECSNPGLEAWCEWCWWWWWWCSNGAFNWWGVRIIVLCWCCAWSPLISIPDWANALVLLWWEAKPLLLPGELWCKSFVFCSSESLHDSDDPFLTLPGLDPLWVLTCLAKWSDLMNLLLHTGQANLLNEIYEEPFVKITSDQSISSIPTFFLLYVS